MLGRVIYAQKELVGVTSDVLVRTKDEVLMVDPARTGVYIAKEKDGSISTFAAPAVATVLMTGIGTGRADEEIKDLDGAAGEIGDDLYFSYYENKIVPNSENPMNPADIENRLRQIEELRRENFLTVDVDRETFIETVNRLNEQESKKSRTIFATDALGSIAEKNIFYGLSSDIVFNKVPEFSPLVLRFDESETMKTKDKSGKEFIIKPYVGSNIEHPIPGQIYKGFLVNSPVDNELRAFVTARFSHFKIGLHVSETRFTVDDLQEAAEMIHIPEDLIVRSNLTSKNNISFYPVSIDTRILMQMSRIFLDSANDPVIRISFTGGPMDPVLFETKGDGEFPDVIVAVGVIDPEALITVR